MSTLVAKSASSIDKKRVEYRIRSYERSDEDRVLSLMSAALGESLTPKRTAKMWRWKHEESPFGESHRLVAESESGDVLGLRAFLRWEYVDGTRSYKAVRAVDTSTHPNFQRMGIFSRLTKRALEDVKSQGVDFIFNTPNDASRAGYLKMGWNTVGRPAPLVKILNYRRFAIGLVRSKLLRRVAGGVTAAEFYRHGEPADMSSLVAESRFEDLISCDTQIGGSVLRTVRTPEYFDWRFRRHPTIRYRATVVECNGRIDGCAVFRTNNRFGLKEVVMSELLMAREDPDIPRRIVKQLTSELNADYVISYARPGSPQHAGLRANGFRRMPGQGINMIANPLGKPMGQLGDLSNWGVTLGDLEFF